MDAEYLKANMGECLTEGLLELVEKRPIDPIEYLAHWLLKYKQDQKFHREQTDLLTRMEREEREKEIERERRRLIAEERERIKKEEMDKKKAEEPEVSESAPTSGSTGDGSGSTAEGDAAALATGGDAGLPGIKEEDEPADEAAAAAALAAAAAAEGANADTTQPPPPVEPVAAEGDGNQITEGNADLDQNEGEEPGAVAPTEDTPAEDTPAAPEEEPTAE